MLTVDFEKKALHTINIYIIIYYLGLEIDQREGLRIIKLNRPKKLNAFNKELITSLISKRF